MQQGEAGASGGLGCFALEGTVDVEGKGEVRLAALEAVSSRVIVVCERHDM